MMDLHQQWAEWCRANKQDAKALINDALCTREGSKLLQALNACFPILDYSFHPDPRFQAHHAGRLELFSLLWRYGTASEYVPDPTPKPHHASENQNNDTGPRRDTGSESAPGAGND